MDWWTILHGVIDGAAWALAAISIIFAYRAVTMRIRDDSSQADMRRQVDRATVAVIAAALAVALLAIQYIAV